MPVPRPDLIVEDPLPLNPSDFPFAVEPFPAQLLAAQALVIPVITSAPVSEAETPHRYQD